MWEVVARDVSHVKLTVAKDRVTIKFPLGMSPADQTRYSDYCRKIVEALGPVDHTLRGSFKGNYVFMHTGRRGANSRYFCEGIEGTPPAWKEET